MTAKVCFIHVMWQKKDNLFFALKNMVSPRQTFNLIKFWLKQVNPKEKLSNKGVRSLWNSFIFSFSVSKGYISITLNAEA